MKPTNPITIASTALLATLALAPTAAHANRPTQLTVAIYAPSVELSTASRVALVNDVAAAVESRTGIKTTGKAYSSYGDLAGAKPDFAILDPLCIAAHSPGRVLATAKINGSTSRAWGVYAPGAVKVRDLSGKALAYVRTGCRDVDFIEHGVFFGLFRFNEFFAGSVAQADVNGAVVATRDMKKAAAVLAPAAVAGGLEQVLAVDPVPNPGLILMSKTLDAVIIDQVGSAVAGVSGGPIDGWGGGAVYSGLAARMGTAKKKLVLAPPERANVAEADVVRLALPKMRGDAQGQLMWKPPERRPRRAP